MKKGFTLIELIMVIAILAIVSTLAVNRYGNLREKSARTVSLANQSAIGRAVDAFLAANPDGKINYLDSLVMDTGSVAAGEGSQPGFQINQQQQMGRYAYKGAGVKNGVDYSVDVNAGLTPRLYGRPAGGSVFLPYSLSADEVTRLANRDFKFVMRHVNFTSTIPTHGDDLARVSTNEAVVLDPHLSACVARAVTNGMIVCAVNPLSKNGRDIYRDCGQKLLDTDAVVDAEGNAADNDKAIEQVKATGGALLAFGLGADSTIIGNNLAGLESVPLATYPAKKFYRQYILLFHVDTSTPAGRLDFRGVLDPCGFSIRQAREAAGN